MKQMAKLFYTTIRKPCSQIHNIFSINRVVYQPCYLQCVKFLSGNAKRDPKGLVTLARLMGADDANISGNVHGGVILRLLEEAGAVEATRFCNKHSAKSKPVYAVPTLARIEKMDFNSPMFIGEIAEFYAHVTFTSQHSLMVNVKVLAENILTGERRLTNEAHMWYVPVNAEDVHQVLSVPQLSMSAKQEQTGQVLYNLRRQQRICTVLHLPHSMLGDPEPHTVGHSSSVLSKLVNPSDIAHHGYCRGGMILKLMDECAGITAAKHCDTAVVTASLDATNFLEKVKLGAVLTIHGVVTFTSSKSLEVQVLVDAEHPFEQNVSKHRAVEAFFTFVSLDAERRVLPVTQIKIKSSQELSRFEAGKDRYTARRNVRQR